MLMGVVPAGAVIAVLDREVFDHIWVIAIIASQRADKTLSRYPKFLYCPNAVKVSQRDQSANPQYGSQVEPVGVVEIEARL